MKLFRMIETVADGNYRVGDKISFTLNDGENVEALAVKQEDDGMIFYFVDALKQEYRMNRTNSTRGGYEFCEFRKNLNGGILDRFPAEIREKMVAFENGDFLRLATECEIFGENIWSEREGKGVQQWEPMKDRRNRISYQGNKTGTWEQCWLQNKSCYYPANFCQIDGNGYSSVAHASEDYGVRPAFKI